MLTNVDELITALDGIGLITRSELDLFLVNLPADSRPTTAQDLARELVKARKLSRHQAAAVYQDKAASLVFGDYILIEKIGAGGMGQVFKAHQRRMRRVVALKLLPTRATKSPSAVKRFYREVEMAAKLVHPNIVQAFDAGAASGQHYLAMEFVDGPDLATLLHHQETLPIDVVVNYMLQAAKGLAFAHSVAIIHRDIKPGNLLVTQQGVVKILDMGLARMSDLTANQDAGLTQAGEIMGTVDYMAPEQGADSRRVDQRADIYSLGCTMFRLLTGDHVFKGSVVQKMLSHRDAPIPSICEKRADAPLTLQQVFEKMVAKRPEDRYANMAEVAKALESFGVAKTSGVSIRVNLSQGTGNETGDFLTQSTETSHGGAHGSSSEDTQRLDDPKRKNRRRIMIAGALAACVAVLTIGGLIWNSMSGDANVTPPQSVVSSVFVPPTLPDQTPPANPGQGTPAKAIDQKQAKSAINSIVPFKSPPQQAQASGASPATSPPGKSPAAPVTPDPQKGLAKVTPPAVPPGNSPPAKAPPAKSTTPPAMPPPATPPGDVTLTKPVNLLAMINPPRDTIVGEWKMNGTALASLPVERARLQILFPIPRGQEYRLTADLERMQGEDGLGIGLVVDGSQTRAIFDGFASTCTGLDTIGGVRFDKNDTALRGKFIPLHEPMHIVCEVRRTHVRVECNGRTLIDWEGPASQLDVVNDSRVPNPACLYLTTTKSVFEFRKLELEPLPAESQPAQTATLDKSIDLLERIELPRHAATGNWRREGKDLVSPLSRDARLQIPFRPPEEYVLTATLQRVEGRGAVAFGIPVGSSATSLTLDNFNERFHGLEMVGNRRLPDNDTKTPGGVFSDPSWHELICVVTRDRVRATLDGQVVTDWTGDPKQLSMFWQWKSPSVAQLALATFEGSYRFKRVEIAPIGKAAEIEAASVAAAQRRKSGKSDRLPVPSAMEIEEATGRLTDAALDAPAARKPDEIAAQIGVLLDRAEQLGDDSPARYVLIAAAQKLSPRAQRLAVAYRAIDALAGQFEVDGDELEKAVLADIAKAPLLPAARLSLVDDGLKLVDQAVAAGRYPRASSILTLANTQLTRITSGPLLKEVRARLPAIKEWLDEWQSAQEAIAAMKTTPEDAPARLALGRYLCVVRTQWEDGLPHLAAGSDPAWNAAAKLDIEAQADATLAEKAADAWWDIGEKLKGSEMAKFALMERAVYWYQAAPPGSTTAPVKVSSRIDRKNDTAEKIGYLFGKRHPFDAKYFEGHWYKRFDDRSLWSEARLHCESLGGKLVCIESAGEDQFIDRLALPAESKVDSTNFVTLTYWIGATDEAEEGIFRWVDGRKLTYSDFSGNEPNNQGGEHYVGIRKSSPNGLFRWNDFKGDGKYGYICEWER